MPVTAIDSISNWSDVITGILKDNKDLFQDSTVILNLPFIIVNLNLDISDFNIFLNDSIVLCQISESFLDGIAVDVSNQINIIEQTLLINDSLFINDDLQIDFVEKNSWVQDSLLFDDLFEFDFIEQNVALDDLLILDDFVMPIVSIVVSIENVEISLSDNFTLLDSATSTSSVNISNISSFPILTQKIKWTTDVLSDSQVKYGTTPNFGNFVSDPTLVTTHSIVITNLLAGKKYYYQTKSQDSLGNVAISVTNTFNT